LFEGALLKRSLVMLFVWFANSFVYYGLSLNSGSLMDDIHLSFAMSAMTEVPSLFVGAYLVDTIGRRPTLSGAMILSGTACTFCMVLPDGGALVAMAMIGYHASLDHTFQPYF